MGVTVLCGPDSSHLVGIFPIWNGTSPFGMDPSTDVYLTVIGDWDSNPEGRDLRGRAQYQLSQGNAAPIKVLTVIHHV